MYQDGAPNRHTRAAHQAPNLFCLTRRPDRPRSARSHHFNPEHPENHNIKIPNKKQKFALIQRNGKWEYRDKKHVIENIVDNSYNILDEHFEEHHTKLKNSKREDFLRFQEMFEQIEEFRRKLQIFLDLLILPGVEDDP